MKPEENHRFYELDLLRGFALILMVIWHLWFDLDYLGIAPLDHNLYSQTFAFIPILFLTICGISLSISYNKKGMVKVIKQAFMILTCAVGISAVSFYFIPTTPVYFGILHCIAISMLLGVLFVNTRPKILLFGSIITLLVFYFISLNIADLNPLTYILGISNQPVQAIDYFPVFPWVCFVLIGIALGEIFYRHGERQFNLPELPIPNWLLFPGQYSLQIYLLHQPIIYIFLKLFLYMRI